MLPVRSSSGIPYRRGIRLWGKDVSNLDITEDLFRVWEDSTEAKNRIGEAVSRLEKAVMISNRGEDKANNEL